MHIALYNHADNLQALSVLPKDIDKICSRLVILLAMPPTNGICTDPLTHLTLLHTQALSALPKDMDKICSRLVILPPKPRAAGNVNADPSESSDLCDEGLVSLKCRLMYV